MIAVTVDLTQESEVDLLYLIGEAGNSNQTEDYQLAHASLQELHSRHFGYLRGVLRSFAENCGTITIDPDEYANQTFAKIMDCAPKFQDKSNGDKKLGQKLFRAWLGKIAKNLAKDQLKKISRNLDQANLVPFDETYHSLEEIDLDTTSRTSPKVLQAVKDGLDALKPEERDVVMILEYPEKKGSDSYPRRLERALKHAPDMNEPISGRNGNASKRGSKSRFNLCSKH